MEVPYRPGMAQSSLSYMRLPYVALPYQETLINDYHRFLVIVASRRVGKTVTALNKLLEWAITRDVPDDTPFWYVAPFYNQAKTIAWHLLMRYVPKSMWARKPNESSLTMYLTNGRTIQLKGADNPTSLEGTALGGLVVDEISLMTHWTQLWDYSLRPMLADYEAPAMFISKPRGFNHFHDLAKMGDWNNIIEGEASPGIKLNKDFMTYRFETEINCREHNGGYIHHEEIETARESLPPEAFAQEWLGKFTKYTGLVHKDFDRAVHIVPNMELPHEWRRVRGWDFGSNHPTASIRIAIDPDDNWWVETVLKERDVHIKDFAEQIKEQDKDFLDLSDKDTISGYGDPSGRGWIKEFNAQGMSIRRAIKDRNTSETNWLQLGIDKINAKLKIEPNHVVFMPVTDQFGDPLKMEGAPSFFVLDRPENYKLVAEFETLAYKETATGINRSEIDENRDKTGHFDLDASLRYFAVSYDRKIVIETLPGAQEVQQAQQYQAMINKAKPVYVPAKIDMNDPIQREEYERQADMEAIRNQTPI